MRAAGSVGGNGDGDEDCRPLGHCLFCGRELVRQLDSARDADIGREAHDLGVVAKRAPNSLPLLDLYSLLHLASPLVADLKRNIL
jgi:hypothetical protein